MKKEYANIRVSLEVKTKIDELSKSLGTADNALRALLGLTIEIDERNDNVQTIPMQFMIVVVLKILDSEGPQTRLQIAEQFQRKLSSLPDNFKNDKKILPSNFRPRWYAKLGNAIYQGRQSELIKRGDESFQNNKFVWELTPKGQSHLQRTEAVVVRAAQDPGSSFILNLLK